MRVLLTGAAGFIGAALTRRLRREGAAVTALCPRHGTAPPGLPEGPGLRWVAIGLQRTPALVACLRQQDAVVHLAGRFPLLGQPSDPDALWQANALGTRALLEACDEAGVRRVLLASSAHVYGVADPLCRRPLREDAPLRGTSAYALSKIGAEQALTDWAARSGERQATSLRFFNVYGPGQSPANVVSAIGRQALAAAPVSVYCDWPERDFVYVDDVVDAVWAALHRPGRHAPAINIASGQGTSIRELAGLALRLAGRTDAGLEVREQVQPSLLNPLRIAGDPGLAHELLDWRPATSLAQGLATTLEWMRLSGAAHPPLETPCP